MINLQILDESIIGNFIKLQGNLKLLLRVGSSLHPESFHDKSDIDYIVVVKYLPDWFVNKYPDRESDTLPRNCRGNLRSFYWRMKTKGYQGYDVNIIFYTFDKFIGYLEERSGNMMYLLHDYKVVIGEESMMEELRNLFPPNLKTAINDYRALLNPKYNWKFLWGWRSVCLMREGRWLSHKRIIEKWVNSKYPQHLQDKEYLKRILYNILSHWIQENGEYKKKTTIQ